MGRIEKLAERFGRYVSLPWQKGLAGAQRAIFIVYNKMDERRLINRKELFSLATVEAGHTWTECNLANAFSNWMSGLDYRDSYFESPEDLELKLEEDFLEYVIGIMREALTAENVDSQSVVGVFGIASLFGFLRVSEIISKIENSIRGRLVVFFPGEFENANYRLLDARDGWNYHAVPITLHEEIAIS
ncbi:MAG: BREX protein BrxB domain-containing protein [Pseudomonadota bacterium]